MGKPYIPQVIIGEAVAGEAAATKKKIDSLINSLDKNTFDIAELLYTAKVKEFFIPWGYSSFKEYSKTFKKLKPRKVQYLTRIVGVMTEVGITRDIYEPLGISRLREITSLDPKEVWTNPESKNKTPMAEFIKGFVAVREDDGDYIDTEKLKGHVRTLKGFVGDNDLVYETLCMIRSAYENSWKPAIALAKAHIGSVKKDDEGMSEEASNGSAAEKLAIAFLVDPQNELGTFQETADEEVELQEAEDVE